MASMIDVLTPDLLIHAYKLGVFPMAKSRDSADIQWIEPRMRGIFPLNGFHVSRSLSRAILRNDYQIRINSDFAGVMQHCANRDETWINAEITSAYCALQAHGYAHSLEVWAGDEMIGGVYGVAIGRAFFGESMFSRRPNGSKIALAHLVDRLTKTGYELFDTQFITPHLASLGAIEIPQKKYKGLLRSAITGQANFSDPNYCADLPAIAQRSTHTS